MWDTACKWISNSGLDVNDSRLWANYGSAQYDVDGKTKIAGSKQTTGKSEYWKAKNIYDLAGNLAEWSYEKASNYYVRRGAGYNTNWASSGAAYRYYGDIKVNIYPIIGFRIALYIM